MLGTLKITFYGQKTLRLVGGSQVISSRSSGKEEKAWGQIAPPGSLGQIRLSKKVRINYFENYPIKSCQVAYQRKHTYQCSYLETLAEAMCQILSSVISAMTYIICKGIINMKT